MTTTPLNVDLLEEDDDEEENIGAETNAVQPQVIEKKDDEQTRLDEISNKYNEKKEALNASGLFSKPCSANTSAISSAVSAANVRLARVIAGPKLLAGLNDQVNSRAFIPVLGNMNKGLAAGT